MARSSQSAQWTLSNDATWLAWVAAVSTALNAVLLKVADSADINAGGPAATPKPAGGAFLGYEVFQFNDALQATKPVFIKVEYGTSSGSATAPTLRFTIGTTHNGAGTVGGRTLVHIVSTTTINNATVAAIYASGDGSYVTFFGGGDPASLIRDDAALWFVIERTRDFDGTPNGDGIFWASRFGSQVINPLTGVVLTYTGVAGADPPIAGELAATVPNPAGGGSSLKGDTAYAYPVIPHTLYPHGPSQAILQVWKSDFPRLQEVELEHYGVPMTFMSPGNSLSHSLAYKNTVDTAVSVAGLLSILLRFE